MSEHFSSIIEKIMPEVQDGSDRQFALYRGKDGGWHCGFAQEQDRNASDWTVGIRRIDPLAVMFTGKDFAHGSYAFVYDAVLAARIREEYHLAKTVGNDTEALQALTCFFEDNTGAFSQEVTEYLSDLGRPLTALSEMCPLNLATDNPGWTFNEDLAPDAIDHIEKAVSTRLQVRQNDKEEAVMSSKMIHFIDSDYKELFQIPDGGSINITYPPGDDRGTITRQCKFLDEYHTRVGNETYHICEFAENMERIGARYEPEVQLRGMKLESFTPGDEKYYTYNREEGNSCVGHISGDFGNSGDRFHNSWRNHQTRSEQDWSGTSPEFQAELHSAVYALRYQYNFLKDSSSMRALCDACPEALIDSGDKYQRYGFKLETDTRQYYTQCFFGESMRDARFIIYAYENPAPELEQTQLWEVLPRAEDENKMFYRNDTEASLSVGYLRGDYGKDGNEFHHQWFDNDNGKNTPEFKSEFQVVMNGLRKDILKDLKSSQDFCYQHPQAQLPGDIHRYGFKVETKSRQYFVRCTVIPNDYFYVFAYDKTAVREQERQAGEKPSVLKQIRDAEKAPKTQRKPKAASQSKKKDGAEL